MTAEIKHRIIKHAGHCLFTGVVLHDIEQWQVPHGAEFKLPDRAQYVHGFRLDGVRWSVYERTIRASSEKCPNCGNKRNTLVW